MHAALRGRFAGSTETFLAKDLETVDKAGIDGVITALARTRKGNLSIDAQDFEGVGRGSRSYPLLYLLARLFTARDLATGRPLGHDASAVSVHEIFPKPALAKAGYSRAEVNAIANFAFLTPSAAVSLNGLDPADYLGSIRARGPARPSGSRTTRALAGRELPAVPRGPPRAAGRGGERLP